MPADGQRRVIGGQVQIYNADTRRWENFGPATPPGDTGGVKLPLTLQDLGGGVGLGVEGVELAWAALHEEQDAGARGLAAAAGLGGFQLEKAR